MPDITKIVETLFTVVDKASSPMAAIGERGASLARSLMAVAAPVTSIVAGIASIGAARGLAEMHSQAEGTRLAIAGTLKAFGAVESFTEGVEVTRDVIAQINRDSAALPGSAQDYVEVYRTALPAAMEAGIGSIREIANFTNKVSAIGIANQIDAQQVARDTAAILRGHAGAQVRTWSVLQPLIGKSAEEFNHMAAPERNRALQVAIARYEPLLGEFSNTWDAVTGSIEATIHEMTMGATAPLFDAAKKGLMVVNEWLSRNSETVTRVGRVISEQIVDRINHAVDAARMLRAQVEKIGIKGAIERLLGAGGGGIVATAASVAARGAFGPIGSVVTGSLAAFATHLDALQRTFAALKPIVGSVISVFQSTNSALSVFYAGIGDFLAGVLPPLASGLALVIEGISGLWSGVTDVASTIFTQLRPSLTELGEAIGQTITVASTMLRPAFEFLSSAFGTVAEYLIGPIAQGMVFVIGTLVSFYQTLASIIAQLAGLLSRLGLDIGPAGGGAQQAQRTKSAFDSLIGAIHSNKTAEQNRAHQQEQANRAARRQTPAARGGAHTTNDFRYSRFDVTQKFAEGFDPDRIAVAFASDLESLANQRLESGLSPAFGLR